MHCNRRWIARCVTAIHSAQGHSIAIAKLIRTHFETHAEGSLHFWEFPSKAEWFIHPEVHKKRLPGRATQPRNECKLHTTCWGKKKARMPRRMGHRLYQRRHQGMGFPDHQDERTQRIPTNVGKNGYPFLVTLSPYARKPWTILNHAPIRPRD